MEPQVGGCCYWSATQGKRDEIQINMRDEIQINTRDEIQINTMYDFTDDERNNLKKINEIIFLDPDVVKQNGSEYSTHNHFFEI